MRENSFDKATIKELTCLMNNIADFYLEALDGLEEDDANKYDNAMSSIATAISRAGKIRGY